MIWPAARDDSQLHNRLVRVCFAQTHKFLKHAAGETGLQASLDFHMHEQAYPLALKQLHRCQLIDIAPIAAFRQGQRLQLFIQKLRRLTPIYQSMQ